MKIYCLILLAVVTAACGGSSGRQRAAVTRTSVSDTVRKTIPKRYGYKVVKVYPHSENSYTQGLFWNDGHLWESIGEYGRSALLKVDLESGREEARRNLGSVYFAEGTVLHDGKIYQLTWLEGSAFVYDPRSMRLLKVIRYDGEGWGIASDGRRLYTSDGSERIVVRNPDDFAAERVLTVTMGGSRLRLLNELEWIDGEIWANVYLSDLIVTIDPQSGNVTGVIDLSGLQEKSDPTPASDVLNGIAYDSETGRVFVTGKRWNKLYEIEIIPEPAE